MAVFKEKNGVWKPGGYLYGWLNPQILPGRSAFGRSISQHPPFFGIVQISKIIGNILLVTPWRVAASSRFRLSGWGWLLCFWSFAIPKLRLRLPPGIEPCPFFRVSVRHSSKLANARNVRAAATTSDGSIRKGG